MDVRLHAATRIVARADAICKERVKQPWRSCQPNASRQRGVLPMEVHSGTMQTNGGNYAGSGQKIVVPPFIGVSADVTLNLGVLWDNMNIYMTCDCIGINFYVEMFGVKTFV